MSKSLPKLSRVGALPCAHPFLREDPIMKHTVTNSAAANRAIDAMSRKYVARMFTIPTVLPSKRDGWLG